MKTARLILPLFLFLFASVTVATAAPPSSGVSESASGFPGTTETKTPVPTVAPPSASRPDASQKPGDQSAAPAQGAKSPAARPGDEVSLTNNDLDRPRPLGPGPKPVPPQEVALSVFVDGRLIAGQGFCLLVDPLQEVALESRAGADSGEMRIQGPASMDLSKPREYQMAESATTTWKVGAGALVRQEGPRMVWQAPAVADACRVDVALERQTRFEDVSDTALQSPLQARGLAGDWAATFIVRAPFDPSGNGIINDYTVGIYPNPTLDSAPVAVRSHKEAYAPPKFLVPVTPETAGLRVSPHFRLGDFSPASERGKRHFIALDQRLVDCLEGVCGKLATEGISPDAVRILRAYVSPYQRQLLAREGVPLVEFTRFQYGDSATILIDADGNGMMDDLTGDGAVDIKDADRLADLVEAVQKELKTYGGVGVYHKFEGGGRGGAETPCVQIDLRGWRQRWRSGEE